VCVRGKASSPGDLTPGVGGSCYHDDLFDTVRVSSCRNFALRASILVVTSVAHRRILWESLPRFLGSIPLVKELAFKDAIDCRIDEDESFITVDDQNQNDRAVRSP
jgi:hypothetical protein